MLKTNQSRRIAIGIAILVAFLAVSAVLYLRIGKPMVDMVRDPARLRAWLDGLGWKSRIVYAAMVCFQVIVAIIPGEPLELAAGYAFGAFEGTLICLAGIFIGSMIVFLLVRRFGVKLVRLFFSDEKINSMKFLKNPKRLFIVTSVLMLVPGTPKDLLTYCAGLTTLPITTWMLICSVGRIPSVITSTLGGHALSEGNYVYAAIVFGVTALLCGGGLWLYARMQAKGKKEDAKKAN